MSLTLEKDIEAALTRMVKRHGGLCLKWVCPGWSGVPDRMILLPGGRIIFAELKRPGGPGPRARQKFWQEKLTKLGFLALTIYDHQDINGLELFIK